MNKKPTDFSTGRHREMLIWQRRQMWTDEAIERIADWLNLEHGMTVVDVGCGLGYLGHVFWDFFGKGGHYHGIDIKETLLTEAEESAASWATDGTAKFTQGDAYKLPLPDNSADAVMCQTLMIHLEHPKSALSEMIRVARPGGRIFCIEPDNLRPTLVRAFSSLPEFDLETQLLLHKANLIEHRGRMKLGRGDNGVAPSLPHLIHELGVDDIDVRVKESVPFVIPPYTSQLQQEKIENMKNRWLNEENFEARVNECREEYLEGGGDPEEYERILDIGRKQREVQLKQIENGEFSICGAYPIYLIKATKPQ